MTGPRRVGSASAQLIGGSQDGVLLSLTSTPREIYVPRDQSDPIQECPDTVPELLNVEEYRLLFLDEDRQVAFYLVRE